MILTFFQICYYNNRLRIKNYGNRNILPGKQQRAGTRGL